MAHVLIGFGEALPAAETIFSLRSAGHRVSVFAQERGLPLERLRPERVIYLGPGTAEAVATLRATMNGTNAPDFLFPLDDAGLWLANEALDEDSRLIGATGQQAQIALDKTLQIAAAQHAGLAVPETHVLRGPGDLDARVSLPAIAKPALAIHVQADRLSKGKACYLLTQDDVAHLADSLSDMMVPLLVQPLVRGVGEGVFGFATPQGVRCWSGHRRLRMMNPHGSGSSACMSCPPNADTRQKVEIFLAEIGWRGPFMVELLRDADGTAWFMELNGRIWGSLALARRQGFEYPAWAVADAIEPGFCPISPDPFVAPQPLVLRNLGREILHLAFLLRGPKSTFHRRDWPRFWKSLRGVLKPAHPRFFYNYDLAHPLYFLFDTLWTLRKAWH